MCTLLALLVVTSVGDEFHVVVFVADAGVDAELAKGERHRQVSSAQCIASAVVVAHLLLFQEIQLVVAHVRLV